MKVATINGCEIHLVKGDITEQDTDAIVNAANSSLLGGGGVDGAIHRKGGKRILQECKEIRRTRWPDGMPTGNAVITAGGDLKARHVIHTVGPIWGGGDRGESGLLSDAYRSSLTLAFGEGLRSIAFPSISTGVYGYPIEEASRVALTTIREFLEENRGLEMVVIVFFSESDFQIGIETAGTVF